MRINFQQQQAELERKELERAEKAKILMEMEEKLKQQQVVFFVKSM